jgi:hypothetical protein
MFCYRDEVTGCVLVREPGQPNGGPGSMPLTLITYRGALTACGEELVSSLSARILAITLG